MYTVVLEPSAQRDMRKLSQDVHARVLAALGRLGVDPHRRGLRRLAGFEHQWRARVGDYRVLYEVDEASRVVHVYRIVPRSEAYR